MINMLKPSLYSHVHACMQVSLNKNKITTSDNTFILQIIIKLFEGFGIYVCQIKNKNTHIWKSRSNLLMQGQYCINCLRVDVMLVILLHCKFNYMQMK